MILARGKLEGLTSVRFFFAMMVVVGHFTGQFAAGSATLPGFVYNMAPLAVSWFFVLSGFIIAYNYPELEPRRGRTDSIARKGWLAVPSAQFPSARDRG